MLRTSNNGIRFSLWIIVLGLLSLVFDNHPHYLMGDSGSYLSSWPGVWVPPDRSWLFGFMVHAIVVLTHSLDAYIALQVALQCAVAAFLARVFLPIRPRTARLVFIVFAVCDPLLAAYARFYMSDFFATMCLGMWVAFMALVAEAGTKRERGLLWAAVALAGILAVFIRVAYAPIEVLTLLLLSARVFVAGDRKRAATFLSALLVPVMAIGLLIGANGLLFRDRLSSPFFLNRLSGVFIAGVFAPALEKEDIQSAGVAITAEQFRLMRLGDYHLRVNQVWAEQPTWLHNVVTRSCHSTDQYDPCINAAMSRMTHHAFFRNPAGFASVFLRTLVYYFRPSEWRRNIDDELGLNSPFSADFIEFLSKVLPFDSVNLDSPKHLSRVTWILRKAAGVYPILVLLLSFLALGAIVTSKSSKRLLLACGLISSVILAPLYSNYVIPRYILPVVLLGYLLLTDFIISLLHKYRLSGGGVST